MEFIMKNLNKKYCLLFGFILFTLTNTFGQIKVSEFIQPSKIATTEKNTLYYVDFWATWCVPCVTAKEYVGVLQKQFPENFYAVSISEESPLTVERYLKKHATDLAVAIDYNGETFKKFNARVLPKGILFNAKGDILWSGHTADLKPQQISKFLKQEKRQTAVTSFFKTIAIKTVSKKQYMPSKPIEVNTYKASGETNDIYVEDNADYLKLTGSLASIFSHLAEIYEGQINIDSNISDEAYEVYFKKPFETTNLAKDLMAKMKLKVETQTVTGEALYVKVKGRLFWDTNQINWGKNNAKYIIGDAQIQADNVSFKSIAYQLSKALDIPVIIPKSYNEDVTLHDWDFHYKYFELMKNDLEDNYGITVERKTKAYEIYKVSKI